MLPLSMAGIGETMTISMVKGNSEVKKHLEDLGFVVGTEVQIIQSQSGNMIVNVKDSRLALTDSMAGKIMGELKNSKVTNAEAKKDVAAIQTKTALSQMAY